MEEKKRKTDRRTVYTRRQIMNAYIQLLKKKPKDKIRVTEICNLAEINRCTFYLHFLDVADVEESIEKNLAEQFNIFIEDQTLNKKNDTKRLFLSNHFQNQLLSNDTYVTLMKSSRPASSLLNESLTFGQNKLFDTLVQENGLTLRQAELVYEFVVGGVTAVQRNWIDNDIRQVDAENQLLDLIIRQVTELKSNDL